MSQPLSGEQYVIKFEDQQATICSVGAMVREYQVGGRDVFVPFDANQVAPVYNAAILAPWPNRLGGGKFTFDGYSGQLPVNELDRQNALHGLICWENWWLVRHGHSDVTLEFDLPARSGWPYQLRFTARYWLDESGLNCRFTTTNIGSRTAPYGVGFHPWLSSNGADLDACDVRLDATEHVKANDLLLPVGAEPVSGDFDLRERRSLGRFGFRRCLAGPNLRC